MASKNEFTSFNVTNFVHVNARFDGRLFVCVARGGR